MRFRDRPTGDILVLAITFTVCVGVLASGVLIAVISFFYPDKDVSSWISRMSAVLNTMVGLLAGFLAGRTTGDQTTSTSTTLYHSEDPDDQPK